VIGSVGPGTKLASLDHTSYDILEASYAEQARGLIDGGIDLFLCETNQDLLTVKAAVNGIRLALAEAGRAEGDARIPIFVQITIETTGTMLVGSDIACAAVAIDALDVDGIGLNCATGPAEMAEHVRWLGEHWRKFISVMPNAGLPMLVDGKTEYPLLPRELSDWHARFLADDGINLVGGCCGTTPEHIREVRKMLDALEAKQGHLRPKVRTPEWTPAVSSLYTAYDLRQENALFAVGFHQRFQGRGVVAFDLAGAERGHPPSEHAGALALVRDAGLALTLHAGEADAAERVVEAVRLGATRIGHGVHLADAIGDPARGHLVDEVRTRGVHLEVCPTSNVHTGAAASIAGHPITALWHAGVSLSFHTDNRLMSRVTHSGEALALLEQTPLVAVDLLLMQAQAAAHSFLGADLRARAGQTIRAFAQAQRLPLTD